MLDIRQQQNRFDDHGGTLDQNRDQSWSHICNFATLKFGQKLASFVTLNCFSHTKQLYLYAESGLDTKKSYDLVSHCFITINYDFDFNFRIMFGLGVHCIASP